MEEIRLQKYLAEAGIASRRKCEEYITDGRIKVNGKVINELGTKVNPEKDEIYFDDKKIENKEELVYILLNKPIGYVTTAKDQFNRDTVMNLIKIKERVVPVGRLDMYTSGALLLSNDGNFVYKITHPKHEINKTYTVTLKGIVTKEEVKKLKSGIVLDGKKIYPSRVKLKKLDKKNLTSIIEITIHDGVNHEVKRMMESIGHNVIKLKRESVAFLNLGTLKSGEKRILTSKEVKQLYNAAVNK